MAAYPQSIAYTRMFYMVISADHNTPALGATPVVNISKVGAAFGAAAGAVSEVGAGWYKVALTTADTGTQGDLAFDITATSCDPTDFVDQVIDPVRGLGSPTALPNAAAEAAGGLYTRGVGVGQINQPASGMVDTNAVRIDNNGWATHTAGYAPGDVRQYGGAAGTFAAGRPEINLTHIAGSVVNTATAQLGVNTAAAGGVAWGSGAITAASIANNAMALAKFAEDLRLALGILSFGTALAGSANTIDLAAGEPAEDDIFKDSQVIAYAGTGKYRHAVGTAYNGTTKQIALDQVFGTAFDATTGYVIRAGRGMLGRTTQTGAIIPTVTTLTTYTGNTPQTGDAFARIGAAGAGLTAIPWNAAWDAEVQSEAQDALTATGVTATRMGYIDWLNIGSIVASQADVQAINVGASRRILITTSTTYERPPSSTRLYEIEVRTYNTSGNLVAADSTPTLTATGVISGDLSANLSSATNPATGVYRWTYTVSSSATKEQIRLDTSATLSAVVFSLATFTIIVDAAATDFTSADRAKLDTLHDTRIPGVIQPQTGDAYARLGANGAGLSAVPWNAAWDTEVESEATDALNAYDPPTNAEMVARTIAAASYAQPGSAMTLTGGERDSIATALLDLASGVESGKTLRQALRIMAAMIGGKISGSQSGTETFVGIDGATTRAVVTVDSLGNRTAVTYP